MNRNEVCQFCGRSVGYAPSGGSQLEQHMAACADGPAPHLPCQKPACDGQRVPYDRVGRRVRWWCLFCHGFSFPTARQKAQAFAVPPSA
jgi:hypothetical protein